MRPRHDACLCAARGKPLNLPIAGTNSLAPDAAAQYRHRMARDSLTPNAWIVAGLSQLAELGPQALRAEPLARHLGTTKGSFYWHFKDVPAYHAALLQHWQAQAFGAVVNLIEDDAPVADRLRRFGAQVQADPVDPALRAWAQSDASVAATVAQVDDERLKYLSALMSSLGITNPDYARAALGASIGLRQMGDTDAAQSAYTSLIDVILALR